MPMLILALLALLPLHAAVAAEAGDCTSPQTNLAMQECADANYRAADAALNAAYGEVMGRLRQMDKEDGPDSGLADALKAAQRAWIPFRDGQCAWEAGFFTGGSIAPLIRLTCLTELTRARTGQLRQTLKTYGEN
ncbi:MAG: lysozyme inhibitor LprI family protein [Sneathiellaceae bacterium]